MIQNQGCFLYTHNHSNLIARKEVVDNVTSNSEMAKNLFFLGSTLIMLIIHRNPNKC
jgi:hypothetical protein